MVKSYYLLKNSTDKTINLNGLRIGLLRTILMKGKTKHLLRRKLVEVVVLAYNLNIYNVHGHDRKKNGLQNLDVK